MEFILVLLIIIVIPFIWFISLQNSFRRMLVKIDESESGIDVALTQRFDMLTKMYQAAKGYMKHEKETLEKIGRAHV